jgi:uncharacterized protein with HEPN domain
MSYTPRDQAYLLDILIASRKALEFVKGLSFEEFQDSELHQSAVIRPLEIIGEAARMISDDVKAQHPEIPWGDMIGMRNRLIHEYFDISLATIWETVHDDLPHLIQQIAPLVPADSPE